MAAEKKGMSLPLKLLIGIAVGIVCGLFLPERSEEHTSELQSHLT